MISPRRFLALVAVGGLPLTGLTALMKAEEAIQPGTMCNAADLSRT